MTTHCVYTGLEELMRLRLQAKALNLSFNAHRLERVAGSHLSRFRGRGMEFAEHRRYQPGDDPRQIDWRLSARKSEPYSKVFREEVEQPVLLLVDQRQSLFFGSNRRFKSVLAAEIAALLAWTGLQEQDRIGGLILGNEGLTSVRPRRSQRQILHFLNQVVAANQSLRVPERQPLAGTSLTDAIVELQRLANHGARTFIISDWSDVSEATLDALKACQRKAQIMAIQVFDPLEKALPADCLEVSNGRDSGILDLRSANQRAALNDRLRARIEAIPHTLGSLGIPCLPVATVDDPVETFLGLQDRVGRRSR